MFSAGLFQRAKARVGESLDGSKARNCVCANESPRKHQQVNDSKSLTELGVREIGRGEDRAPRGWQKTGQIECPESPRGRVARDGGSMQGTPTGGSEGVRAALNLGVRGNRGIGGFGETHAAHFSLTLELTPSLVPTTDPMLCGLCLRMLR